MHARLPWLEAMRAIAALWVVLYHAQLATDAFIGSVQWPRETIANGYLGVDFFFILSGFIIAYSSSRSIQNGGRWIDYVISRVQRIYVPYLPVGISMLALYYFLPEVSQGQREFSAFSSLTLLPQPDPPALSVAWTLVHEIIFYAIFSVVFVSRGLLVAIGMLWVAAISVSALWDQDPVAGWWYFLNPINLCFFLGVGVFYLTQANAPSRERTILFIVIAAIILFVEVPSEQPNRPLLSLAFASLIVVSLSDTARRFAPGKMIVFFGAASYAIYLVHDPLISVFVRIIQFSAPKINPIIAIGIISFSAVSMAILYHAGFEKPVLRILGSWRRERVLRRRLSNDVA